jgi:hypothetical protein
MPRPSGLAKQPPHHVQDVHLRERLVVRLETPLVVVGPEPERQHSPHAELGGAAHVFVAAIAHEERSLGPDSETLEGGLEDERVGLPAAHLGGEDGGVETLGQPHPLEILV